MSPSFLHCLEVAARAPVQTRIWRASWSDKQFLFLAPHLISIRGDPPPPLAWPPPGLPIVRLYYDEQVERERIAWWGMPPADVEADDWQWWVD
jgi:hypothetical protein